MPPLDPGQRPVGRGAASRRGRAVLEAAANPAGLPKWCAFQYRNGAVAAYRDHDLRAVEMCRRDPEMVRERAIHALYPSTDEVLDCFRTPADMACEDV